jgi:hypothetical protein
VEHPSDWRWNVRLARWEHPHSRSNIEVIEPAKEAAERSPSAVPFGFRLPDDPQADDDAWEGMGL